MNKETFNNFVGGRFFHVTFLKANGDIREMNARLGVKKYLKESTTINRPENPDVVTVYDMKAKGYRALRLDRLYCVRQGGVTGFGDMASSLAELI